MGKRRTTSTDRYVLNQHGYGSHNAIAEWTRPNSRILDVGCASGYLMSHLHRLKDCDATGIEPDQRYAEEARRTGFRVIEATADEGLLQARDTRGYDHVVYADVLEHMEDPLRVLRDTREVLAPGGSILISLPNVAFVRARLRVMRGIWEYEDSGIFDRTHLRFFTVRSAHRLVEEADYRIRRAVYVGPLTHRGGRWGVHVNKLRPGILANQIVIEADALARTR